VVVSFPWTNWTSSRPALTAVTAASVVSGVISEIAPTNVVLPTPNPPATTILTGRSAVSFRLGRRDGNDPASSSATGETSTGGNGLENS